MKSENFPKMVVTWISYAERLRKKLIQHGVPLDFLDQLQPGLVTFVQKNRFQLSQVIAAILPSNADIHDALLNTSDTDASIEDLFTESIVCLQWLMFEDEPDFALRKLTENEAGQRAVCGAIWGKDDLAYRCRTCESDSTCAVCVPCFKNGDHKDHDYSIMYTQGGCCDCGDVTAWKREGFCSKHLGSEQIQPLSQEIVHSIEPVLDMLFVYWKDWLLAMKNSKKMIQDDDDCHVVQVSSMLSIVVIKMLIKFCTCGDGLLSFISKKMVKTPDLLSLLVKGERLFDSSVKDKIHELLLKLIGEPLFKYEFAMIFVPCYQYAIQEAVKEGNDSVINGLYSTISSYSVQLFTVPTLTLRLVKEINLLGIFMECLRILLSPCDSEDGQSHANKWHGLQDTCLKVLVDLCYSLNHDEVQQYIALEQPDVYRTWLKLLQLIQGMDSFKRQVHREDHDFHSYLPFIVGDYLSKVNHFLVEGVFSIPKFSVTRSDQHFGDLSTEIFDKGDYPRHAKVGKLSEETSACHISNMEYDYDMRFASTYNKEKLSLESESLPPKVTWLISECLDVTEKFLEPEISRIINVASHGSYHFKSCDFLSIRKKLSQKRGGRYSKLISRKFTSPLVEGIGAFSSGIKKINKDMYLGEPRTSSALSDSHTDADAETESPSLFSAVNWPDTSYDVTSEGISFHIPLHRFISLLLRKAMKMYHGKTGAFEMHGSNHHYSGHVFFSQVLGKYHPYGFSSSLMEHPLRLRVFCAQLHAGMWRRNGDAFIWLPELYHSTQWIEMLPDVDLFLLQCCAVLAPDDLFVTRIQERFGLSDYLSLDLGAYDEHEAVLMREMLTLIIQIIKERPCCGLSLTESLQRELIHKLAVTDATHSQLVKALPHFLSKTKQFKDILDIVAVYVSPSSTKQGKYSLRNSYWRELDLYYPHWSSRDLHVVEERYLRICKLSPLDVQLPRWSKIFDPLSALSRIATSKSVLFLIRSVCFYAVFTEKPSMCRAPDSVLITALHLLSLALDVCEKLRNVYTNKYGESHDMINTPNESCTGICCPSEISPVLELSTKPIEAGIGNKSDMRNHHSLISLLVLLLNKYKKVDSDADSMQKSIFNLIRCLLKKFSELNNVCMNELKHLAPDIVSEMPECNKSLSDSETSNKWKLKSRGHQAAIMDKLKEQQSKFLDSLKCSENNDLDLGHGNSNHELVLDDLAPICSLCHDKNSKSPLSFLVHLQKSRLLSFNNIGPPTWEEIGKDVDGSTEEIADMSLDAPSSPQFSPSQMTFSQGLLQTGSNDLMDPVTDQLLYVRNTQPLLSFNNEDKETLSSIDIVEKNIYLSIQEEFDVQDFHFDDLVDIAVRSLGADGLKNVSEGIAGPSRKVSSHHTVEDASPTSTIPSLFDCDGIHISSCRHAVHLDCHDRYIYSLKQRYQRRALFEGGHIVDPNQGELLCPVCRRFTNSLLPVFFDCFTLTNIQSLKNLEDGYSTSDVLLLPHALSFIWSMAKMVNQGKYSLCNFMEVFPGKINEANELALQPILQRLSEMYFPHEHGKVIASKVNHSLMLWDTLKYSLISTEIASRGKHNICSEVSNPHLHILHGELQSSNGLTLANLLQVAHASRSMNHFHLLLRFRGCQFFANSICAGILGEINITFDDWNQDSLFSILEGLDKGSGFSAVQLWKFASDPVLSHDPFSSLMWILFCLPSPFMLSSESFQSLVHLFYIVCVLQALITCLVKCHYAKSSFSSNPLYEICKIMEGDDFSRQYFTSNHINNSRSLKDMVREFTFPYLRNCALLKELLKSLSLAPLSGNADAASVMSHDMGKNILPCSIDKLQVNMQAITELENMFRICSLDAVFNDKNVHGLALKWCEHFLRTFKVCKPRNVLYSTTAAPFRLIKLPYLYQDILERYFRQQCQKCGKVIEEPALCLLCGKLCSALNFCCRETSSKAHSTICGAGVNVFLLIRRTNLLLQRSSRQSFWPSLYLDTFGEEDYKMKRGRPLYLSEERCLNLSNLVASHGLDHNSEVLRQTTNIDVEQLGLW